MTLNDSQKQQVAAWLDQGMKLSEVQTRLEAEFGVKLTYLEVRLLMDDLKLMPKNLEPPKPVVLTGPLANGAGAAAPAGRQPAGTPPPLEAAGESAAPAGGVTLTVDELAHPGAVVSGTVTFSDGQQAQWYLDQTGRLGLATKQKGYKPPASDLQQFQAALESELSKLGY